MPRTPRGESTESVYHVISRGVDRRDIYRTSADRTLFLKMMRMAFIDSGIRLFSYCLMSNHFHLLLASTKVPLSIPMHQLLTRYSIHFNKTNERAGHLFESRYTAIHIRSMHHLIRLICYVHMNPVRAGITTSPSAWPWSSHEEFVNGPPHFLDLGDLEERTGISPSDARHLYRERTETPLEPPTDCPIQELIQEAAGLNGIDPADVVSAIRGERYTRAKLLVIRWARQAGYADIDIAKALRCSPSAISKLWARKN